MTFANVVTEAARTMRHFRHLTSWLNRRLLALSHARGVSCQTLPDGPVLQPDLLFPQEIVADMLDHNLADSCHSLNLQDRKVRMSKDFALRVLSHVQGFFSHVQCPYMPSNTFALPNDLDIGNSDGPRDQSAAALFSPVLA